MRVNGKLQIGRHLDSKVVQELLGKAITSNKLKRLCIKSDLSADIEIFDGIVLSNDVINFGNTMTADQCSLRHSAILCARLRDVNAIVLEIKVNVDP